MERVNEVFLINPPLYYDNGEPVVLDVSYPPLGILYLAALLEKNRVSVRVIDVGAEKQSLKTTLLLLKKEKPLLVGISSMTPSLQGAVTLAKEIRKKINKVTIALGGPHVSADPDFIKRIKLFDFAVTGESETKFLSLIKDLISGRRVKGVFKGEPARDLDQLPWPARHLVSLSLYNKRASLIATRGCPFNCYYCSRPAISNLVRYRSAKDVVDEMESLYLSCEGDYLFQDDAITLNRDKIVGICKEMNKRKNKFRWAGYTRIDLVDDELLRIMAKSGCYSIDFGIESGNERVRNDIINKRFSNAEIETVIKLCNKHKIEAAGFFMFSHPTETTGEVKDTMEFILKNNFDLVGVSIATPFPGSKLWDYAVREKIISYKFIDEFALGKRGKGYAGVYPVYVPKTLNLDWLYQQRKTIMRKFYLRPKKIVKALMADLTSWTRIKRDLIEGLNVLVKGSSSRAPYQKRLVVERKTK